MLDDLPDAPDLGGGAGDGVGVDDAETEVGLEEGVHHDAVAELEDLEGEDGAGEEDEREREEREVDDVVLFRWRVRVVMLLGERGGGASEGGGELAPTESATTSEGR